MNKIIKQIIIREFRKHPKIDWSGLASIKIEKWIKELIKEKIEKVKRFQAEAKERMDKVDFNKWLVVGNYLRNVSDEINKN